MIKHPIINLLVEEKYEDAKFILITVPTYEWYDIVIFVIENGLTKAAKFLVDNDIELTRNYDEEIRLSFECSQFELIKMYYSFSKVINDNLIAEFVVENRLDMINFILSLGVHRHTTDYMFQLCALYNNTMIMQLMIEHKCDIILKSYSLQIEHIMTYSNVNTFEFIINNGFELNEKNIKVCLIGALMNANIHIVKYLEGKGADFAKVHMAVYFHLIARVNIATYHELLEYLHSKQYLKSNV